jgi:hypothetical protein
MFIGDILVSQGLVSRTDVTAALERQATQGGLLGENLVAMGKLQPADLKAIMQAAPPAPRSIEETELETADLLNLTTKAMYSGNSDTPSKLSALLKLPPRTIQLVIDEARDRKLVDVLGATDSSAMAELRYALTEKGRQWAADALAQNQYVGPAPVSLAAFTQRIQGQRITNERVDHTAIRAAFANLIVSERFIQQIGPAINSGRSILLYGPPGNGKTSVAEKIGRIFNDVIYIPYCFEVEGQVIKVFDPSIHESVQRGSPAKGTLRREDYDQRWVPCRRPFIVAGGELTLEMLDLSFNALAKFYEAPLHVKALGGIFAIDDFGRQLVSPEALLNRWIVPLESRVEYLKLHTGKSFSLPFDELVIFSTNLAPRDLMDPAFLRRIPYKLEIKGPTSEEYRQIFRNVSQAFGVEAGDDIIDSIIVSLSEKNDFPLASYQPKFIVDQVLAACKFEGAAPQFRPDLVEMALGNLFTRDGSEATA